ncbi:hypothetical protein DRE_02684 [Drechslerella stenobrocha 248]|uniref:Calcineurin-like phosphoesterase domain-containing protein n=1 Tax=Drechslerella stenobrocha 248 TaxID=1043628 RepID=W7IG04_9PEZI|nr:hypothetical protein DRE_02684 [Drechslerella stenobrocha 248]
MKYEKPPIEDYDDDAQELSVELATNIDPDEDMDNTPAYTDAESDASAAPTGRGYPKNSPKTAPQGRLQRRGQGRSIWVRRLHVFILLFFTTIVVFTFLPTAITKLVTWRHGGHCNGKRELNSVDPADNMLESKGPKQDDDAVNLYTTPSVSSSPSSSYIQLSTLPAEYIPKTKGSPRTLIFVGDIHGMLQEFQDLLEKLESKGFLEDSHIVVTGDMISKGPDSLKLLDTLIALNASCVRGNHEDDVMKVYWKLKGAKQEGEGAMLDNSDIYQHFDQMTDDEQRKDQQADHAGKSENEHKTTKTTAKKSKNGRQRKDKKKRRKHKKHHNKFKHSDLLLAKSMHPHHARYIDSCPLILKLDGVMGLGDVAVVHAGMAAGVDLRRQKPSVLMNVRTFIKKVPTPSRKGIHWSKLWNEYQTNAVKNNDGNGLTVIYGHDARRGLELRKYSKGLDTNCVRGYRLTALVVKGGKGAKHSGASIVSVPCRRYI